MKNYWDNYYKKIKGNLKPTPFSKRCKKILKGFRGKIYGFYDMSSRVRLDRYYFKNWSIFFDLKICFNTIYGILRYNLK